MDTRILLGCAALLGQGCISGSTNLPEPACESTLETVSQDDATLGFSAEDAITLLETERPSRIVWDEMTLTEIEAELALEITGIQGEVQLATPTGYEELCVEPGQTLRIPLGVRLSIDSGDVVAEGVLPLEVGALSPDRVYTSTAWLLPATLSGSYHEAFNSYYLERFDNRGFVLEGVWITSRSTWTEGKLDIELTAKSDDAGVAAAV